LGDVRKTELKASCAALDAWEDHCDVLDLPELQDDPKRWWPREIIQPIVKRYIFDWKIDAVSFKRISQYCLVGLWQAGKGSRRSRITLRNEIPQAEEMPTKGLLLG